MRNNKLARIMKERGITQVQLAEFLRTTQANIGHIVTGRRKTSIEMAAKISEYFGLPVLQIFNPDDITSFRVVSKMFELVNIQEIQNFKYSSGLASQVVENRLVN